VNEITVIKCDHRGKEVFRWKASLLERGANHILVEAHFGLEDHFMGEVPLEPGDRFVETYYSDRWYNSYEVHARADDSLKCWYCNLARPAEIRDETITFSDLALDLLIHPDGRQQLLDEDEFEALDISSEDRQQVNSALRELKREFKQRLES
jgi:hypothetical protein